MFKKTFALVVIAILLISANSFSDGTEGRDADFVVTPYGFNGLAADYPGNVTIITQKDIEASNASYVYEILRRLTGIYVSDYTYAGKTVTVDMRGFGEYASRNVLVMIDGRRINEIDISGPDWSTVPLEYVERIEVLRGAGSVLYGDNAAAGTINIITKKGKKGFRVRSGAEFGNYKYNSYFVGIDGKEDFASYSFLYKQNEANGYRLNGGYEDYNFLGNMEIFPAEYLSIGFSGGYQKAWYGMPAGLQRWEIDRYGYKGSTTPNDKAKTENTFLMIKPRIHFSYDSMDHDISVNFWGRKERLDTTTWDHIFGGDQTWDNSQIDSRGGSVKYVNTFFWDNFVNKLAIGIDLFTAMNRLLTVTPNWGTYNQLTIRKQTLGLYISDNMEIVERFVINGGFRQEWAKYVFDQSENAARYETKTPYQEAFDIGLEYKYLEKGGIYGRFSRSFRFPATDEFYSRWSGLNTGLKHQVSDTWEIGIKDQNLEYLQPFLNIFWMNTKDEIFYDPTQGAFGDNRNYAKTKRFGIETGLVSRVGDWFEVYGNYTYLDARYRGGSFASNRIPMVPEHKAAGGISLYPIDFLELNFNSEYISDKYSINDDANDLAKLKPYFVSNIKMVVKYKDLRIFLGINNLFDKRYAEIASSNVAGTVTDTFPAPERNYVFGMSAEF